MNFGLKELLISGLIFYAGMMVLGSILGVWKEATNIDRFEVISHNEDELIIFDTKTGDYQVELLEESN